MKKAQKSYPKDLNVPKDIVLARRQKRKLDRASKPPKQAKLQRSRRGVMEWKFKIPKERKDSYENDENSCFFRLSRHKNGETLVININQPTMKYLDWFWFQLQHNLLCSKFTFVLFPNVKEQTESVAALFAAQKFIKNLSEYGVIVVGDGNTPRTGYLLSQEAKWVISVDPIMRNLLPILPKNLTAYTCKIEDLKKDREQWQSVKKICIIAVHAHVGFESYLTELLHNDDENIFFDEICIISIPCCIPLLVTQDQCINYKLTLISQEDDYNIISPCRTVFVWKT